MTAVKKSLSVKNYAYYYTVEQLQPYSLKPVIQPLLGVMATIGLTMYIDQSYYPNFGMDKLPNYGKFLIAYHLFMFALRVYGCRTTAILYELMWGCNISILMTGIGCLIGRPLLICCSSINVAIDQCVWSVDYGWYLLFGAHPLGVSAYMSAPDSSLSRIITSFHHIWFLPFCLYVLKEGNSYLHPHSWLVACVVCGFMVCCGRWLAPMKSWFPMIDEIATALKSEKRKIVSIDLSGKANGDKSRADIDITPNDLIISKDEQWYIATLNINCGHCFFEHLKLSFVHFCNDKPFPIYLAYISLTMNAINYLPFKALLWFSNNYIK